MEERSEETKAAFEAFDEAQAKAEQASSAGARNRNPEPLDWDSESGGRLHTKVSFSTRSSMNAREARKLRKATAKADKLDLENGKLDLENGKLKSKLQKIKGENILRMVLGIGSIVLVFIQLIVCDIGIFLYGWECYKRGWQIPTEVVLGWLSASLIEIIGVLWVIARSLFPFRDKRRDTSSEKGRDPRKTGFPYA